MSRSVKGSAAVVCRSCQTLDGTEQLVSFSHKAFEFDWAAFEREFAPTLGQALKANDAALVEEFIEQHRGALCDPYEGEPLPPDWRSVLEVGDLQELSDFALTRYYLPTQDFGLSDEWTDLSESQMKMALLGEPFGEPGNSFDPGRMGAYFQTPSRAAESLKLLRACGDPRLSTFINALSKIVGAGKGLYVTF